MQKQLTKTIRLMINFSKFDNSDFCKLLELLAAQAKPLYNCCSTYRVLPSLYVHNTLPHRHTHTEDVHPLYHCLNERQHEISNSVVCVTSKASDQPAHKCSLIRAFASSLNIQWVLSYWLNIIWSFLLKRRLHRLVWVYTCQNATLLNITCRGSNTKGVSWYIPIIDILASLVHRALYGLMPKFHFISYITALWETLPRKTQASIVVFGKEFIFWYICHDLLAVGNCYRLFII